MDLVYYAPLFKRIGIYLNGAKPIMQGSLGTGREYLDASDHEGRAFSVYFALQNGCGVKSILVEKGDSRIPVRIHETSEPPYPESRNGIRADRWAETSLIHPGSGIHVFEFTFNNEIVEPFKISVHVR